MSYIKINDVTLPAPARGLNIMRAPNVETQTNALGQTVAQKIGRPLISITSLQWNFLKADVWELILAEISKVTGTLTFYNAASGRFETYNVIWGTSSETPYMLEESGKPTLYSSCKCDIKDMGYDAISSYSKLEG